MWSRAQQKTPEGERERLATIIKDVYGRNAKPRQNWKWHGVTLKSIKDPDTLDADQVRERVLKVLAETLPKYEEKLAEFADSEAAR